ncbi:MAG: cysteine hydrolase family protein [Alphaproteobacteria bacterium]|nr:cysteine hydrolase family protein [Alphaproteobacteria bacterium]
MNNRILMRIDFQNDFVHPHGSLSLNNQQLINRHQTFANGLFKDSFDKIIDSYDTHFAETYANTTEAQSYPPHCVYCMWGWMQAAPFKFGLPVTNVYKSTTDIWHEVKNYQVLNEDWRGKEVYLCGVLSDVCVVQAMNGLLKRGANVVIIEDLCQGAQMQISDILQKDIYRPMLDNGRIKTITTSQYYRAQVLDKKIQYNLVNRNKGE